MNELPFAKVSTPGGKKKHDVTLFKLFHGDLKFGKRNTEEPYWLECIDDAAEDSTNILKDSGIELGHTNYRVANGRVVPFLDSDTDKIIPFNLIGAIQERDKENGQTADWLAAFIINQHDMVMRAINSAEGAPPATILSLAITSVR